MLKSFLKKKKRLNNLRARFYAILHFSTNLGWLNSYLSINVPFIRLLLLLIPSTFKITKWSVEFKDWYWWLYINQTVVEYRVMTCWVREIWHEIVAVCLISSVTHWENKLTMISLTFFRKLLILSIKYDNSGTSYKDCW